MGLDEAKKYLKTWNKDSDVIEFGVSSATVELAAKALNTDEARIAKTLSFMVDGKPVLIVTAGNMKIDNRKYKDEFGCKAVMLSADQVKELVGHEIGGVCPFGVRENVAVFLDIAMRRYDHVFPACGSSNSAIRLDVEELEKIAKAKKWIDVCKERE